MKAEETFVAPKPWNSKICVANWKMNKTRQSTREFLTELGPIPSDVTVVICPPFTSLGEPWPAGVTLCAQNFYPEERGAFTGEISLEMLKEFNVSTVLVGHSERRNIFNETEELINRKVRAALEAGFNVILCVEGNFEQQLASALEGIVLPKEGRLAIAYEPDWAIGTGQSATRDQIESVHAKIKYIVNVPVLYGGSVNESNAKDILASAYVAGVLVGGASLDPKKFARILQIASSL